MERVFFPPSTFSARFVEMSGRACAPRRGSQLHREVKRKLHLLNDEFQLLGPCGNHGEEFLSKRLGYMLLGDVEAAGRHRAEERPARGIGHSRAGLTLFLERPQQASPGM